MKPLTTLVVLVAIAIGLVSSSRCGADVFTFKDGRVISGRVTSPPTTKKTDDAGGTEKVWAVEVQPGIFVQIFESSLARNGHEKPGDAEREYFARTRELEETAEAHYELAGWCKAQPGLRQLADGHYFRALDLDPNHKPARVAAGYRQDSDGRWVKLAKVMEGQRGRIQYKGLWRFPEELAIEQAEEERKAQVVAATKDIARWHAEALSGAGRRQAVALENLEQLNDPLCIGVIAEILQGKRRPAAPPQMRLLYLRILARMQTPQAVRVAAHVSVNDVDQAVRSAALDSIPRDFYPAAVGVYLGYLGSKDNLLINRAAEALGHVGGQESILPLIEALVTEHTQKVGGGNTTYQPGAMVFGGKEQTVKISVKNPSALESLGQLTGQSLDFNKEPWLNWYARVYAPPAVDLRRDP